jgi:hypothetical protein
LQCVAVPRKMAARHHTLSSRPAALSRAAARLAQPVRSAFRSAAEPCPGKKRRPALLLFCYAAAAPALALTLLFAALATAPTSFSSVTRWGVGTGGGGAVGFGSEGNDTEHSVCIIGNAGGMDNAKRVHDMWGGEFPVVYYSWAKDAEPVERLRGVDVWVVSDGTGRSFRDGVHYALESAKSLLSCNYFFLHDDDLTFHFNEALEIPHRAGLTLQDELVDVLAEYEPKYATFLWEVGLKNKGVNATYESHRNSRVYPFTAGDSGMTIYHHSIVDFFIPFSPNGEGGFVGNWTLPTHFLDLFARTVFDGIVINSVRYKNNINPDNHGDAVSKWTITPDGFAVNAVSRHKYEWPQNGAYLRLLYSCVRDMNTPQARDVVAHSNVIAVRTGVSIDNTSFAPVAAPAAPFDVPSVIQRLMTFADPRHPALSSSHFLMRPEAQAVVKATVPHTPIDFRITIMTYRRFDNALKILSSLAAELENEKRFTSDAVSISIVIMVDFDASVSEATRQELRRNATSRYSLVEFDMATSHRGLKESWLNGWKPSLLDSFNLVLEDDLDISSTVLKSSVSLVRAVYYGNQYPFDEILGISLFNERSTDIALSVPESASKLIESSDTLRQSVCSWGVILAAPGWRQFVTWLDKAGKNFDPVLKDSLSNRWPVADSWKKLSLRFAAERNMYLYYPQFQRGESLVRKLVLEGGTNDKGNIADAHEGLTLTEKGFMLPSEALSAPRLDYKMEPVSSKYSSFDGCTLVMPICHRLATVPMLVKHYAGVPFKAQIILVQQPCGGSHKPIDVPDHINDVPIVLKRMSTNDMNNRYLNFEEIKYDCVINLDDDVMHPHHSMNLLFQLWRSHFFDYYVGWYPQGRIHIIENGKYVYQNHSGVDTMDSISSMLLPSGSVYHRKFLDAYNSEPNRPAREVVSNLLNCDDVLMNFVIANATNQGPVVVDDWSSLTRSAELKALSNDLDNAQWKSPDHMNKRTECINEFAKIYGRMPLRYSTVHYKYDPSVARYPVRVRRKSALRILFSKLVPNRNTMHDVPDLCHHDGLPPSKQIKACPGRLAA